MINKIPPSFVLFAFLSLATKVSFAKSEAYALKVKGIINAERSVVEYPLHYLTIKNHKIIAISPQVPKGMAIRDKSSLYVMAGFFDCHTHLFLTMTPEDDEFPEAQIRESKLTTQFKITRARHYLLQYLKAGFTSVCDLGNSGRFVDVKLKSLIAKDFNYPRLFVSGPALSAGHAQYRKGTPLKEIQKEFELISQKTNVDNVLKRYLNQQVDILKIVLDGINPGDYFPEEKLSEIVNSKYLSQFKKVTVHATSAHAYDLIRKYRLKSAEHLIFIPNEKSDLEFITNTIINADVLKKHQFFNAQQALIQKKIVDYARSNNIKLVFGPDFYYQLGTKGENRAEDVLQSIDTLKNYGLSNAEIIKTLTINPAESLRLGHKLGKVATNFEADLVLVEGNPLEDIGALKKISAVIRAGRFHAVK